MLGDAVATRYPASTELHYERNLTVFAMLNVCVSGTDLGQNAAKRNWRAGSSGGWRLHWRPALAGRSGDDAPASP
jgi:hypothetical protein